MIPRPRHYSCLLSLALLAATLPAHAQVSYDPPDAAGAAPTDADPASANMAAVAVSNQPPPPLPVYQQPPVPGDGYIWVPGYWARNAYGFYWVPGAWVIAPYVGALWTPGYWSFDLGVYRWHAGYWGPHVGFYGGINYGFGYIGIGYVGGYWRDRAFYYNRAITNVNVTRVTNVYVHNVTVNNIDRRRISYNGGPGGLDRRPTPQEEAARNDRRTPPTRDQLDHARWAGNNRAQWAGRGDGPRQTVADAPIGGPRANMRWNSDDYRNPRGPANGAPVGNTGGNRPDDARGQGNRPSAARPDGARPDSRPGAMPGGRPDAGNRPSPGAYPQAGPGSVQAGRPDNPSRPQQANRPDNPSRP
ncbi:YXWGXW repeat-containing protein, partial [Bordetella hinzii]|uniref:YXWGXW repeat-containing protein n=1 Tax=Bordetella hinzii TaxID=103855 RepID=UPI003F1C2D84